jgi:hypothetical protein
MKDFIPTHPTPNTRALEFIDIKTNDFPCLNTDARINNTRYTFALLHKYKVVFAKVCDESFIIL